MTPRVQTSEPNLFELSGYGTQITYSTSGIDGKPHLSFKNAEFNESFAGTDIRTLDSELGKLVTVSLVKTVDQGYTSATVLIPSVALGGQTSQPLSTLCIISRHIAGIQPGQTGARQTYNSVNLNGTAKLVVF